MLPWSLLPVDSLGDNELERNRARHFDRISAIVECCDNDLNPVWLNVFVPLA
jgi:hypothetical protein